MSLSAHHPEWSPRRRRVLALPFVVLCAVVYLGSAMHFAFVQHSTCLEHGESIHVDEDQGAVQPRPVEVSFADERVTQSSQSVAASHGADAHCAHTFFRREGLAPTASVPFEAEVAIEPGRALAPRQIHPEPVARLRLAPKSSPPLS
ncbi:hypothetical protein [Hyalangium gracile]|uniref:hypothetical protein n=1 Tax=Hyalangium gracile TaxID=394092 RepID=UPI001CCBB58D|nr:hypothetical protein [Hyalangium gracile]